MRKDRLVENNKVLSSIYLEYEILLNADHPFLANLQYFYASEERFYFVMPFIGGGELSKILKDQKKFQEYEIKFYITQLIIGIKYLHDSDIMHRDLKL